MSPFFLFFCFGPTSCVCCENQKNDGREITHL
jgi:hypothetical protein